MELLRQKRRRRAVLTQLDNFRVSKRFGCRMVGQHRNTQSVGKRLVNQEKAKQRRRLREIAAEQIRWVRRIAPRLLRREGRLGNRKRIDRLTRGGSAAQHPEKAGVS